MVDRDVTYWLSVAQSRVYVYKCSEEMLTSKVALITGAAQGIGLATARLMLQQGAKVSLADISKTGGVAACEALRRDFGADGVMFIPTDVTDSLQLRRMFQATLDAFGGIDILCNNAGIVDERNWKKMISVNMVAVMESTHLAVEFMSAARGARGGVVINVSSMGGILPMPYAPSYCGSKHGIVGFTRSMTECLTRDNVRVNCICPEYTDTDMVRENLTAEMQNVVSTVGLLQPEEVAEAILQLAMDQSKVGAVMTVTLKRGIDYFRLPGDQSYDGKKGKL